MKRVAEIPSIVIYVKTMKAKKFIDFVVIPIGLIGLSMWSLSWGDPDKMDPIRKGIAELYDKTNLLDGFIKQKHRFGRVKTDFTYDDQLNGQASMIYLRLIADDYYRCKLLYTKLNEKCPYSMGADYWQEKLRTLPTDTKDPGISALRAAASQYYLLSTKYRVIARGTAYDPKTNK